MTQPSLRLAALIRKLSLSIRSPERGQPFFINPTPRPTAMSITTSPMTPPERPEVMESSPLSSAYLCDSSASVIVPT